MKQSKRIAWSAWGDTHPGTQRENNEDCVHCDPEHGIFIVVDGMGGEAAGEVAAYQALACIRSRLQQETGTVLRRIREAITSANNEVYRLAQQNPAWRGMACVLTVAVLEDGKIHIGHVGDTRLYVIRNGEIQKVTPDHSPVGMREDAGEISELEAMRHPRRNEVYRDVGSQPRRPDDRDFIDYVQAPFEPDAAMLLCSDGLSDMISSSEIQRIVQAHAGDPKTSVARLIEKANAAGGRDNISVIVVEGEDFSMTARRAPADSTHAVGPAQRAAEAAGHTSRRRGAGRFILGLICGLILAGLWQWWRQEAPVQPAVAPPEGRQVLRVGGPEFPTIESALARARPGDSVEAPAGEYKETIRLRPGVTLAARESGKAIIVVTDPAPADQPAVLAEKVQHATLLGFVIRAAPRAALPVGLRITDSDVTIADVEVTGTTKAGVWVDGDSHPLLTGVHVHSNSGAGIIIAGTSAPRLVGNVIQRNGGGKRSPAPGIQIIDEARPTVSKNVISANGGEGIRIRRPELKEELLDNFFSNGASANKRGAIGIEKRP